MTELLETAPQIAKRWGVTRGRVHQLIVEGKLRAHRIGRDWLIPDRPELAEVKSNQPKEYANV